MVISCDLFCILHLIIEQSRLNYCAGFEADETERNFVSNTPVTTNWFLSKTRMEENSKTFFAPQLMINNGVRDISFYSKAFGAIEHFCLRNDDGSIHVAELSINDAIFHLHEVTKPNFFSPEKYKGTTTIIGLFVPDVDAVMNKAIQAGAIEISVAKDYEYGYRQGEIEDLFGHHWLIEKKNG